MRASFDGGVVYSEWYYNKKKARTMTHVLDDFEVDYPLLAIVGKRWVIDAPVGMGFATRMWTNRFLSMLAAVYDGIDNKNNLSVAEFGDNMLVFMMKIQDKMVSDRWFLHKVKPTRPNAWRGGRRH